MMMKKMKIGIVIGIVLVVLGVYLALNPAWITKPKYMLDSQYCEQNSDCVIDGDECSVVNKYNYKESQFACQVAICANKCSENNRCIRHTNCIGERK